MLGSAARHVRRPMRAADRPSKLRVTHGTGRMLPPMYLALVCGPLATQLPDLPVGLDRWVGAGIGSSACPAADAGGRSVLGPSDFSTAPCGMAQVHAAYAWREGQPEMR